MSERTAQLPTAQQLPKPIYGDLDFETEAGANRGAIATITVDVLTSAGARHVLRLRADATVKQAKQAAAGQLSQPAQLQRWMCNGSPLTNEELIGGAMEVLCTFLAPKFDISVKVILFRPPAESQLLATLHVCTSPVSTVHSLKFEVAEQQGVQSGKAMRLFRDGSELQDGKTLEDYHIDPGDVLELIVPRPRDKWSGMTEMERNYRIAMGLDDSHISENLGTNVRRLSSDETGCPAKSESSGASATGLRVLRELSNKSACSSPGAGHALLKAALNAVDDPTAPQEDLPDGWMSALDPQTQQTYYYKTGSNESQWERPVKVSSRTGLKLLRNMSAERAAAGSAERAAAGRELLQVSFDPATAGWFSTPDA